MPDIFPTPRASFLTELDDDPHVALRQLGARAHQLRAATRAADHYNSSDGRDDRNTGSWLMSCAVNLAGDLAGDLDSVARTGKERATDAAVMQKVVALRVRAHQLHAAARAADHFLDQDTAEDRDTGSWLIATAYGLAQKLAAEIDDGVSAPRRAAAERGGHDAQGSPVARRVANA